MSYSVPEKPSLDGLEETWQKKWSDWGTYSYARSSLRSSVYSIDTPPPTVSGSLHIGHVFSYTHTDIIARFKRMQGFDVFYPIGWDDNGVPTERRVQNYYGIRCDPTLSYDITFQPPATPQKEQVPVSRRNFVELCQMLTFEDEKAFEELWRHLGLSVDWSLTYTTVGPKAQLVSQAAFLSLIAKGEVYSAEAPTLWDVDFATAVSQAELEDRDTDGAFHKIRFYLEDDSSEVVIETTRPELIPAVVALVANPNDKRYEPLFGKSVYSPLFGVKVPVLAHELAEPDKGSGIAMVCTFGDLTDVTWWKELKLDLRLIVGRNGRLLDVPWGSNNWESKDPAAARENYRPLVGKPTRRARDLVVDLLDQQGHLVESPRKIKHAVKFYEKGDKPLEVVASRQWFIRTLAHKEQLLKLGAELNWVPAHMRVRYESWVEGLNTDWNISRQRFFGIPIPAWYPVDAHGEVEFSSPLYPSLDQLPIDPSQEAPNGYLEDQRDRPGGFTADPDVMDTWATSSLTPQIATSWLENQDLFNSLFPMDLRPQGQDIIRTWLFYTVLRSALEHDKLPWRNTVISGFVLDPDRKKMSKSKGNVVTPMPLLVKYGADALRYWAASGRPGVDTAADESQMKVGRRMAIKLLNASRFALTIAGLGSSGAPSSLESIEINPLDLSMLEQLKKVAEDSTTALDNYEHTKSLELSEKFFWNFCDNYLELVKLRAYGQQPGQEFDSPLEILPDTMSARICLLGGIRTMLRLLAPFMPFVCEEVWSWFNESSLHLERWPSSDEVDNILRASASELFGVELDLHRGNAEVLNAVTEVLTGVRKIKSEAKRSMKSRLESLEITAPAALLEAIDLGVRDLCDAGGIDALSTTAVEGSQLELKGVLEEESPPQ